MGYLHINSLYKDGGVLHFRRVYAMEKIHGTSAHLLWDENQVKPFGGGINHPAFLAIFDGVNAPTIDAIKQKFIEEYGAMKVCIYGEAYGGNCQNMSAVYGTRLRFIVFDVKVDGNWLPVPTAHRVASKFGLEFVDYELVDSTVEALDVQRLRDSVQAIRNGCGPGHIREGIVIRPEIEVQDHNGNRVIAKHKNEKYEERQHPPKVQDLAKQQLIADSEKAAEEFVTAERLRHVLDKVLVGGVSPDITHTGKVVQAMVEDVLREGAGEVVDSKPLRNAIGKKTATMFKAMLQSSLGARHESAV